MKTTQEKFYKVVTEFSREYIGNLCSGYTFGEDSGKVWTKAEAEEVIRHCQPFTTERLLLIAA